MERTIARMRREPEVGRRMAASLGLGADLGWLPALVDAVVFEDTFRGRFADRAQAIRVFEEHAAAVAATVPPERLLVFEAGEGWEPLCRFLGVPVPAEPFPHLNDSASVAARIDGGAGAEAAATGTGRRLAAG